MKKHVGFTVVQMVMAMVLFAILSGIGGNAYNTHIKQANKEQTTTSLRLFAGSMEDATLDLGMPTWATGDADIENKALNYLNELEDVYFTCSWNGDTFALQEFGADYYGFMVETAPETDAWSSPFRIYYILKDGAVAQVLFASAGPNGTWSDNAPTGYLNKNYDDDIVMQMELR